ncbi:ATP-binding protein [Shewanella abyssi]|uniref:ATP-binding protein n=1 Tax=Shewanella abyssi TaxID=311789 RepID=UPI00200F0B00|nr:ATP-binding protein [Shewanella abyssi]MCL1048551.1 ATP-binding protein [Shewanella abyssi]
MRSLPKALHSLKARLIVSALLLILILMPLIGFTLNDAFKQQVKSASMNELKAYVYAVLAVTEVNASGIAMPEVLLENQFNVIQSGLYATITTPNAAVLTGKSNNEFDAKFVVNPQTQLNNLNSNSTDTQKIVWRSDSLLGIELPNQLPTPKKGQGQFSEITLNGQPNLIYSFSVSFELPGTTDDDKHLNSQFPITIHIIKDQTEFQLQVDQFTQQLWRWLMILMGLLLVIQMTWLWWTLKPLSSLETELSAIENGKANQLNDDYPTELQAVAQQLNTLLSTEQNQRKRYRNALADLAHSLKTPLAVIQSQADLSPESLEQVSHINRIIGHQLKRAQSAAGSAWHLGIPVVSISDKLVRNLPKIYCQPLITIEQNVDRDAIFKGDESDLAEILGNLLDNACKAASSKVLLTVTQNAETLVLQVEDDGNGVDETLKAQIFERGIRADSYKVGHGIGLAIVRDLVDSYHGELSIAQSPLLGGACFTINFKY